MSRETLPASTARLVAPRAIRNYAQALGWLPVPDINGGIAVFHRPDSELHQLIVPLDETYDDYADLVAEAVRKLADFENASSQQVLNHLLLPPADVLRFRDNSPESETGSLLLEQGINLLNGSRRLLLSQAHSVLKPQPYHPRLRRTEAEQFVHGCRMGQTERGSFVVTVACPLDIVPATPVLEAPFARKVTQGVMASLLAIVKAADQDRIEDLADQEQYPLMSANFFEALLMLRPASERASLEVAAHWSKALPLPDVIPPKMTLQLRPECFEAAEYIAPKLRSVAEPKPAVFLGFVDALRGQADTTGAMCGEVVFAIMLEDGETIRARTDLNADDYRFAGAAHLENAPVSFRGTLHRVPRSNRVDQVTEFRRIQV